MKIMTKIMLMVGGVIICLCLALGYAGNYIFSEYSSKTQHEQLIQASKAMKKEMDYLIDAQHSLSAIIQENEEIAQAVAFNDLAALNLAIKDIAALDGVEFVTVVDANKRVLARSHSSKTGDILPSDLQSVSIPLQEKKGVVGMGVLGSIPLALSSAVPLEYNGEVVGVILAGKNITSGKFVNDFKDIYNVEATVFLDDMRMTTTILRDGKPAVGTPLNNPSIYGDVIGQSKTVVSENVILGKEYDTIYWPWQDHAGKNAGIFFVGVSREVAAATQRTILYSYIGAGGLLAAVFLLLAFMLVRTIIVRPIQMTTNYAKEVAGGNFASTIHSNSKDEMGTLIESLGSMVRQLKERLGFSQGIMQSIVSPFVVVDPSNHIIFLNNEFLTYWGLSGSPQSYYGKTPGELLHNDPKAITPFDTVLYEGKYLHNHPAIQINAAGEKKYIRVDAVRLYDLDKKSIGACMLLTDTTGEFTSQNNITNLTRRIRVSSSTANDIYKQQTESFNALKTQLDKTSAAASTEARAAQEAVAIVSAMSTTLEDLARKALETSENTKNTRTEAENGREIVNKTVEHITQVADHAEGMTKSMEALGERATNISNIVELIKDVADQTNLLALNAAIEAARAGDAGRGFAVVADEVRKLAEKTMDATNEVNSTVSALQTEVEKSIALTEQTAELSQSSTEFARQSGESLHRIVGIAEQAVIEVASIADHVTEQSQKGASVASSMSEISVMAEETVGNMGESQEFVGNLAVLSDELEKLITTMSSNRRNDDRFIAEIPYTLSLAAQGSSPIVCTLIDINLQGMRLAIQENSSSIKQNQSVIIVADKLPLSKLLNNRKAILLWKNSNECGLQFTPYLNTDNNTLCANMFSSEDGWSKVIELKATTIK